MALVLGSTLARADGPSDAYSHFQRAVTLYSESDFTAALVEFKRAYALGPPNNQGTVNVLYNIGQTQFQLQRYAEALATFERYVSEGGTAHNTEAESAIATLRDRVGRIDVTTNVPADIQIDDELVGKTPLSAPLTASIGRRKITAIAEGSLPATAWSAGEVAAKRHDGSIAVDFYAVALAAGKLAGHCGDATVGDSVVRALSGDPKDASTANAHKLAVVCYEQLATALRQELWAWGSGLDSNYFANACGLLKSHHNLSGLQARECTK